MSLKRAGSAASRRTMTAVTRKTGNRRGVALMLVIIFMVGFAALAMSSMYLRGGATIVSKMFERERDYRYTAEAALAQTKSRVTRDSVWRLAIPETSYVQLDNARSLTDAQGTTIPRVLVNTFVGYTGDTIGRYGTFLTVLSMAYDGGGTRHVRRLDISGESFSKYAMFTNTWQAGLSYGDGEFIRGRAHSNQNWVSSGSPGPAYFDTVSAVTTISGTATYNGLPTLPGSAVIPFPTVAKLAALPTYATNGNLNFTPVSGSFARATTGDGTNVSGTTNAQALRATRVEFLTIDVTGDGLAGEEDGFIRVFDLAQGIDTSRIRADFPGTSGTPVPITDIVMQNQCGAMFTIGGRPEFFPVASYDLAWVKTRIQTSTLPTVTAAAATAMDPTTRAGIRAVLSLPTARCFPAGSPYLLLTERLTDNTVCNNTVPVPANGAPYLWGASPACVAANRYGGQDTTFTFNPRTCAPNSAVTTGRCLGTSVSLGAWRTAAAGITLASVNTTIRQNAGSVRTCTRLPSPIT